MQMKNNDILRLLTNEKQFMPIIADAPATKSGDFSASTTSHPLSLALFILGTVMAHTFNANNTICEPYVADNSNSAPVVFREKKREP